MIMTFYYDIDDLYHEGREFYSVKADEYPFEVELTAEDLRQPMEELHTKYYKDALKKAAYEGMYEYAEVISKCTRK